MNELQPRRLEENKGKEHYFGMVSSTLGKATTATSLNPAFRNTNNTIQSFIKLSPEGLFRA